MRDGAGLTHETAELWLDEALDEHAHELAEGLRYWAWDWSGESAMPALQEKNVVYVRRGIHEAADHIDPKVEKKP